ncbi:MAG: AAA family ATPase, partial [Lachnospiraceae bacterium]|nr:AAA family ATPase [Lachnospiraceae bacterium]
MRLLDVYISGFGKFHDKSISFEDGLNIIYGKNEAGKSTLHTFIRSMLFGMERLRGRAAKTDSYSQFLPWENKGGYEGRLRLEKDGKVYRIERNFQNSKEFVIVDETLGREIEPTRAFMDSLLNGLSETAYINTISIGQLKSATDAGMVAELRNYIANLNTSGNMALNITKATAFLKTQRKSLESQIVPEAARSYAALLGEIRNIEKEITLPEYENHLTGYRKQREQVSKSIAEKQQEKEELLQKIARGRQLLNSNQFTAGDSIASYESYAKAVYS